MAQIRILREGYIKGIMRYKDEVVEVASAEATQYTSNGMAEDVSDTPKKTKDRAIKKAPKKKAK
jgi:hypothetical protein